MATNHFKVAYDELISIIKTAYVRFQETGRLYVGQELLERKMGKPDGILIHPIDDELLGERSNQGRDDAFHLELVYWKRQSHEIDYDELTQFAENLIATFEDNRASSTNWHYFGVENVVYSIELPEPEEGDLTDVYGFTMEITILKGKYS